tara:strand:- start:651 stop:962 length:312 start_codon:yes stop_codon:yes gene_type:complete
MKKIKKSLQAIKKFISTDNILHRTALNLKETISERVDLESKEQTIKDEAKYSAKNKDKKTYDALKKDFMKIKKEKQRNNKLLRKTKKEFIKLTKKSLKIIKSI